MPIDTKQLIELIIQPTLKGLNLYSPAAEQLIACTCAQESGMGTYLQQIYQGAPVALINPPGRGIFQMEINTHDDIYRNFLSMHWDIICKIYKCCAMPMYNMGVIPDDSILIYNLKYATAMCRVHYLRVKEPLPAFNDIDGMWAYYKQYYNTAKGAATKDQFLTNYAKYVQLYYQEK